MALRLVMTVLLLSIDAIYAQVAGSRGSIIGSVNAGNGKPIGGATVLVIQLSTGLERDTVTDENGLFTVPSLLPGAYEVRVDHGPIGAIVRRMDVAVGAALQVNVTLGETQQPGVIDATAAALSIADAEMTQVIPFQAIRDLPIAGRRFQEFATLTPTTISGPETLGQLSFVGQRGVHSNILIDGSDYNEPFLGGIRGGDRSGLAFTIPQSAIAEFQTVTSGYSAEFGRSTSGVLNAITRSGSNDFHGEAFYQNRHRALSADTPLGQEALENQSQFGGAAGGRIIPSRLLFFGAVEQQLARFPRVVRFGTLSAIPRTPDVAPALEYFRSLEGPFEQTNDATAALGRGDLILGGGNHVLAGRYGWSRNNALNAAALGNSLEPITNRALSGNGRDWNTIRTAAGQLTSAFRPTLLNDFRLQHSYEQRKRIPNSTEPLVEAAALGSFGTTPLLPLELSNRRFQVADAITVLAGAHTVKFGADYSYLDFFQWYGENQQGSFIIANPDAAAVLRILSRSGGAGGNRFDDPSVLYRRQVGNLMSEGNAHQLAFFAQDTWRVLPTLTLNFGLRWEGQRNPSPIADNEFLVNSVRNTQFPLGRVDPTVLPDQLKQWAPRFSFAWNPGRGATVLRGHTGIFYGQVPFVLMVGPLNTFRATPSDLTLEIAPGPKGTIYQQFLAGGIDLNQVQLGSLPIFTVADVWMKVAGQPDPFAGANVITTSGKNFRNPRSAQAAVSIERRFAPGLTADYQFNYVNTVGLTRAIDYNVPTPVARPGDISGRPFFGLRSGTARPNPNLGSVLVRDSNGRSLYTGNSFRVRYRGGRVDLAMHYTLGFNKSDHDGERALTQITYGNPYDLTRERNWSALDARHTASGYVLFRAPFGIDLTSLFRYRSGLPVDATTGADTAELLSGSLGNRPFERPGVPFLRNAFRNRDFKTIDARLLKGFSIAEGVRLQFSAELFNLLNFDNVRFLSSTEFPDNPAFRYGPGILPNGQIVPPDPGFLRLRTDTGAYDPVTTGQLGSPLQAQLGVRVLF